MRERITLAEDPALSASENQRQAIVVVTTRDGNILREQVVSVRGTAENPMERAEVEEKCLGLIEPVTGPERAMELIERVWSLEKVKNIRDLRPLIAA